MDIDPFFHYTTIKVRYKERELFKYRKCCIRYEVMDLDPFFRLITNIESYREKEE
jgi:hypothetical protein